jgi:photosystem II stability/assembly factor-like uncharacterized protein
MFAVGNSGTILKYNGTNWTSLQSPITQNLRGVWGTSTTNVFVVGENGQIWRYNGTTWNPDSVLKINTVWGSSSSDVYIGGEHCDRAVMLHYNGNTWTLVDLSSLSLTSTSILNIWGSSNNDVYALGSAGEICHSTDYGITWTTVQSASSSTCSWALSSSNSYIGGMNKLLIKYDGSEWTSIGEKLQTDFDIYGIWGTSPSDLFAVGDGKGSPSIRRYDGENWSDISEPDGSSYNCIWGLGSNAYAGGFLGTGISQYNGTEWLNMDVSKNYKYLRIWGSSKNSVFAVGEDQNGNTVLFHYNGNQWVSLGNPTQEKMNSIWGTSESDIYVVGNEGAVTHYGINR